MHLSVSLFWTPPGFDDGEAYSKVANKPKALKPVPSVSAGGYDVSKLPKQSLCNSLPEACTNPAQLDFHLNLATIMVGIIAASPTPCYCISTTVSITSTMMNTVVLVVIVGMIVMVLGIEPTSSALPLSRPPLPIVTSNRIIVCGHHLMETVQ